MNKGKNSPSAAAKGIDQHCIDGTESHASYGVIA
jgi:hypothetical protein